MYSVFSVKADLIRISLDFLQSNDYEAMSDVIGELDFITEISLFSDKCSGRELQKMNEDFNKELKRNRGKTRVNIWKYIKDTESGNPAAEEESSSKRGKNSAAMEMHDTTVSQNPKINYVLREGFHKQIASNKALIQFKLVHYRLHPKVWKSIGIALGGDPKDIEKGDMGGSNLNSRSGSVVGAPTNWTHTLKILTF